MIIAIKGLVGEQAVPVTMISKGTSSQLRAQENSRPVILSSLRMTPQGIIITVDDLSILL